MFIFGKRAGAARKADCQGGCGRPKRVGEPGVRACRAWGILCRGSPRTWPWQAASGAWSAQRAAGYRHGGHVCSDRAVSSRIFSAPQLPPARVGGSARPESAGIQAWLKPAPARHRDVTGQVRYSGPLWSCVRANPRMGPGSRSATAGPAGPLRGLEVLYAAAVAKIKKSKTYHNIPFLPRKVSL